MTEPTFEQKMARIRRSGNPYTWYSLFEEEDSSTRKESRTYAKSDQSNVRSANPSPIERLLDEVLGLYQPHVARNEWARVTSFRTQFLQEARINTSMEERVRARLEELKFSLMPGEKVEYNRAPSEAIISELKKLLS